MVGTHGSRRWRSRPIFPITSPIQRQENPAVRKRGADSCREEPGSHFPSKKDEQLWELPSYRMQLGKQTEMPDCCSRRWTVSSVRLWLRRPVRVSSLLREAGSRPKHREEEAKQTRDGSKFRQPKTPAFLAWRTRKGHLDEDRAPKCRRGLS